MGDTLMLSKLLGIHNVAYVSTHDDYVYAFDADSNGGINAGPLWPGLLADQHHSRRDICQQRRCPGNSASPVLPDLGSRWRTSSMGRSQIRL